MARSRPAARRARPSSSRARASRPPRWPSRSSALGADVAARADHPHRAAHAGRRDRARRRQRASRRTGSIVFTSANGVDVFLGYLARARPAGSARSPAPSSRPSGRRRRPPSRSAASPCDVVADDFVAEGLLEALEQRGVAPAGTRVLIPRAREARAVLPDALRARGARVDVLPVYDTVAGGAPGGAGGADRERRLHHLHVRLARRGSSRRCMRGDGRRRPAARRAARRRPALLHRPGHQRRAARAGAAGGRRGRRAHGRGARGGHRRERRRRGLTPPGDGMGETA